MSTRIADSVAVPLREVCMFIRGVGFEKYEAQFSPAPAHVPILRAGNIQNHLDITNDLIWVPEHRVTAEQRLRQGDVAMCLSSGSPAVVGKNAQLLEPFNGSVGAFCGIIRPRDLASARYLGYWFRSSEYFRWRDGQARGANIQNLRFSNLEAVSVPWPPAQTRDRIVAKLNDQMAAIEKAEAAIDMQLEAANTLVASFLRQVFSGHDAHKWPEGRLGDFLQLRKEIVHPRDNPKGAAKFVGLEHIEPGTGVRIGEIAVEMSALTGRKPRFYPGDIVYGYLRPYLNKVWIAEFEGLCSVDQYVYSTTERADATFIAWFMRSPIFLERAPISTTPGQLPRIRTDEVAGVAINLPPIKEQQRIATALAERMERIQRLKSVLKYQATAISSLASAQLRRVFAGGING